MANTREIWSVPQNGGRRRYSGYANFSADGRFLGTAGGYGKKGVFNSSTKNASKVQNIINTVGARISSRTPSVLR